MWGVSRYSSDIYRGHKGVGHLNLLSKWEETSTAQVRVTSREILDISNLFRNGEESIQTVLPRQSPYWTTVPFVQFSVKSHDILPFTSTALPSVCQAHFAPPTISFAKSSMDDMNHSLVACNISRHGKTSPFVMQSKRSCTLLDLFQLQC